MKNFTNSLIVASLVLVLGFSAHSQDVFKTANVGIGTTTPTQKLDIVGNIKFSGALMPNNSPGSLGNILLSGGGGTYPTWLTNGANGSILTISGGVPSWSTAATAWQLAGNAGTTYGTNFIGTTTDAALLFKVNNSIAGRIEDINTANNAYGNTTIGYLAFNAATTAFSNVAIGKEALRNNTTASQNVAIGDSALAANTISFQNTAIGYKSLAKSNGNNVYPNYFGCFNTAIGGYTLWQNTTGNDNVAIGDDAGYYNSTGSSNTFQGLAAGFSNTTGSNNVFVGYFAGVESTSSSDNMGIGYEALYYGGGTQNEAFGESTMIENYTGNANTAVGYNSLNQTTYGSNNTAIGNQAIFWMEDGGSNAALGNQALYFSDGDYNVAIGDSALWTDGINNYGYAPGFGNSAYYVTALGYAADVNADAGYYNSTAIGAYAQILQSNQIVLGSNGNRSSHVTTEVGFNGALAPYYSGAYQDGTSGNILLSSGAAASPKWLTNGANGSILTISGGVPSWSTSATSATDWLLTGNVTGTYTYSATPTSNVLGTATGGGTGFQFEITGNNAGRIEAGTSKSTALGYQALNAFSTGSDNTALGYQSLFHAATITGNVAIGSGALFSSVGSNGGAQNTAVGYQSLYSVNSTSGFGFNNTAVGYQAGYNNTTGIHNTSVGSQALYNDNGGSWNTAVGEKALYNEQAGAPSFPSNGTANTAVGFQALLNNNDPSSVGAGQNSAFGVNALQTNITGAYNTGLGYGADVSTSALNNATAVGALAQVTQSNSLVLGSINGTNGATANTYVGIGTTAPFVTLHVVDANNISSDFGQYDMEVEVEERNLSVGNMAGIYLKGSTNNAGLSSVVFGGKTTAIYAGLNNANNFRIAGISVITPATANGAAQTALTNAKDGSSGITVMGANGAYTDGFVGIGTATPITPFHVHTTNKTPTDFGGYYITATIENVGANTTDDYVYLKGSSNNSGLSGIITGGNTTGFYNGLDNQFDFRVSPVSSINSATVGGAAEAALTAAKDGTSGTFYGLTVAHATGFVGVNISNANPWIPNQALEIGPSAAGGGTLRIDALKSGGAYNPSVSGAASTSNLLYANNTTGDIYGLVNGTSGAILTLNASGIPTWSTSATSGTAWQLLGNAGIGTPAAPATYGTSTITAGKNWLGTTDGNDVVFGTDNIERMRIGGGTTATAGNVGIGTSTPATTLHVVQTGNHTSDFTGYNVALQIENPGGTMPILYIKGSTSNNPNLAGIVLEGSATSFYTGLNNNANYRIGGFTGFGALGTSGKDGTAGITVLNAGSGNVGLNYITPANALDINGAEAIGYAGTAAPSNGLIVSGNTGIGTNAPATTLHVVQTGNHTSDFTGYNVAVQIENPGGTMPILYIKGSTSNNPNLAGIVLEGSATSFYTGLNNSANYRIGGFTGFGALGTSGKDGTSGITVLNSNGNVGIGVIAPAQALQVLGSVQFSQALMPNGAAGSSGNILLSGGGGSFPTWLGNGASAGMVLTTASAGAAPTWVTPTPTSTTAWQLTGNSNTTAGTNFIGTTNTQDLVFKANNTERMRILNSNGYVGIGTATPTQPLYVKESGNGGGDFGVDYDFAIEAEDPGGTNVGLYLNGSTSNIPAAFIVERASSTAFFSGLNNTADYRIAPIAGIDEGDLSNAKDGTTGITVLNSNGFTGIGQSSPQTVLDMYYGGGDGSQNDGITIENGYYGDNFKLWVSDGSNSEDNGDGGFNIWNPWYGADQFTIDASYGNVGLGGNWQGVSPQATVSVMGNQVIGYDYANDYNGAPGNGLIVEGQTSIGTTSNSNMLDVSGGEAVGSYAGNNSAPSNGLIVSGNVGLGTAGPANRLDVNGAVSVGAYAGTAAPANGLIVSGQAGVGTSAPDASAALDVTSSSKGLLVPRMSTAPSSPATGLLYFNTGTGCFMFWNGTAWQAIACGCNSIPANAGTITSSSGLTTFCPGDVVTYSVSPIAGATNYNWSIPSDAILTSGAGTNSITITFGNDAGTISVNGSNSCSSGAASTLTVVSGGAAITGQPSNVAADCASPGTVTFTVTATGASLTYAWQLSTNGGSTWTPLTNTAPYSNVATATLSITNPTSGMNGYEYECIVTTTSCGGSSVTSNSATLTTGVGSVPITLTNTVGATTTSANLPVKLSINFSSYTSGAGDVAGVLNTSLNNVEFSTGGGGSGTPLYAWIENGSTSTPAIAASSSSTSAIVWVNLGSTTITNGTPVTIYMNFMGSNVMTGATGYTGEAPEITGTYGQYDNGAKVFSFYDGFAGTSLNSSNWSSYASSSGTITVNNGLTISVSSNPSTNVISSTSTFAPPFLAETYAYGGSPADGGRSYSPGLITTTAAVEGIPIDDNGTTANCMSFSAGQNGRVRYTPLQGNSSTNYEQGVGTPANYDVISLDYTGSTNNWYLNYSAIITSDFGIPASSSTGTPTGSLYFALGEESNNTVTMTLKANWARIRISPPNNTLPSTSIGAFGCH